MTTRPSPPTQSADDPEGGLDDARIDGFKSGVTSDRMVFLGG